jgi:hypothetical protein
MRGNLKPLLLVAGALALIVGATACGSSSKSSATTTAATTTTSGPTTVAWAGSVCSALTTWQTQVTSAGKSIAASPTKATVNQAIASAKTATSTLTTTLKGLETPTTTAGPEALKALQELKGELQNGFAVIQRTVSNTAAGNVSQSASTIKTSLVTMRDQMDSTFKELRSLPSGQAAQAFADAPACKSLESNSSG